VDQRTTLEKLQQSYGHEFVPPLDEGGQLALLFAYRRALTEILVRDQKISRLEEHNKELDLLLQQWIINNPTRNKE
jgi:hypothetical protein